MNREDIIRMAREAGVISTKIDGIERFATLVAAASASVEREACAKVAKQTVCDTHLPTGVKIYGTRVAQAIRARSQQ